MIRLRPSRQSSSHSIDIAKYGQSPTIDKCLASFVSKCVICNIYFGKYGWPQGVDKFDWTNLFALPESTVLMQDTGENFRLRRISASTEKLAIRSHVKFSNQLPFLNCAHKIIS